MHVCKVMFSIDRGICGRWSITYPNLKHTEAIKISKQHCQALHKLDEVMLEEIPLRHKFSSGVFTTINVTPKRIGVNLIQLHFGQTHNDGACTGERMTYHGILCDQERATTLLNVTMYKALFSTSNP